MNMCSWVLDGTADLTSVVDDKQLQVPSKTTALQRGTTSGTPDSNQHPNPTTQGLGLLVWLQQVLFSCYLCFTNTLAAETVGEALSGWLRCAGS